MYRISLSLLFALIFSNVQAQSLQVSTSNYNLVLPSALVNSDGVQVSDGTQLLQSGSYSMPSEPDPSIKVYPLNNGGSILRENIANFLFYDTFGRVQQTISNSTQSEGGESDFRIGTRFCGENCNSLQSKIVSGGNTGSRAKLVTGNSNPTDIFYSDDRALRTVVVSDNGELIALATMKDRSDDQIAILDRFGNNLGVIEFDQDVKGISFSENGLFITIYSGGRAAVYEIRSKERVGSTSFRNTSLLYASYSPEDKTIVAVTGSGTGTFTDIEGHAVNVSVRKIARTDISGSFNQVHQPMLKRNGSGQYELTGFSQVLSMRARF